MQWLERNLRGGVTLELVTVFILQQQCYLQEPKEKTEARSVVRSAIPSSGACSKCLIGSQWPGDASVFA